MNEQEVTGGESKEPDKDAGYEPSARAQKKMTLLLNQQYLEWGKLKEECSKIRLRMMKDYVGFLLRFARATPIFNWVEIGSEQLPDLMEVARLACVPGATWTNYDYATLDIIAATFKPRFFLIKDVIRRAQRLAWLKYRARQREERLNVYSQDMVEQRFRVQRGSPKEDIAKSMQQFMNMLDEYYERPDVKARWAAMEEQELIITKGKFPAIHKRTPKPGAAPARENECAQDEQSPPSEESAPTEKCEYLEEGELLEENDEGCAYFNEGIEEVAE